MEQYTDYPVKVPGRLESAAVGGIVADAKNIYDIEHQKKQSDINAEIEEVPGEIERIDEALNDRYTKSESYNKTEINNKESNLQNQIDTVKGGSNKSINTIDTEINGNGGIDERLQTVEQLGAISVGGGDIGIATASDFEDPTPEQRAKVPTVGAILDNTDNVPIAGSTKLVTSDGIYNGIMQFGDVVENGFFEVKDWEINKYLDTNGQEQTNPYNQLALTNYIYVKYAYLVIVNAGKWGYANALDYAFYDKDKNYIANSGGVYDASGINEISIPENAVYMRCVSLNIDGDFSNDYVKVLCFEFKNELSEIDKRIQSDYLRSNTAGNSILGMFCPASVAHYWNNKTTMLINGAPLYGITGIKRVKYKTDAASASVAFGLGYFNGSQFNVAGYAICKGVPDADGAIEVDVVVNMPKDKALYPFLLVLDGSVGYEASSAVDHYYTASVSGIDDLNQPLETTTVSGNGINFAEFELLMITDMLAAQLYTNAIYVSVDGKTGFSDIQSAVNYAKTIDSIDNPVTIFVGEGTFERFDLIGADNYISVIGCGREKTIVKSTTGMYETPAANIATNGIIKGITFLSNHDDIESLGDNPGSYAVHSDMHYTGQADRLTVYEDCDFISYQTAGFGCGLDGNETLILRNCNFYSYYTRAFNPNTGGTYPSLLVHGAIHDNSDPTKLVVENCKGYTLECDVAVYLEPYRSTNMEIEVRNCQFWSATGGINVEHPDAFNVVNPLSYNNNIPKLNYQYSNNE